MAERQRQVASIILKDPAVESLTSFVGVDGTNPALNSARLQINLKPLDERDDRVQTVISRPQQGVDGVPGVALHLQPTQDPTIDTTVSRTPVPVHPAGNSLEALSTWVPPLSRLQAQPQLADVSSDWQDKGLAAYIKVDRDSASRLGISMADVDNALYNAFGQRLISTIYTQANQYRVVLEQDTEATPGLAALDNIRLTSSDGGIVPLTAIATVEQRFTSLSVNHLDQFPVTTISFNVPDNYSLGEAVDAILAAEQSLDFPTDIRTQFRGSSLAFQSALGSTVWLVVAAVVAMHIVLGVLYESFIHPITIPLHPCPPPGSGRYWRCGGQRAGCDRHHRHHSADRHREEERHHDDRLRAGRRTRASRRGKRSTRPACCVSSDPDDDLAALLGALPLMLSTGVGAELRRPLGIGMVGGLMLSQVLTLFTTPVIYLLFDRLSLHLKRRFRVRKRRRK